MKCFFVYLIELLSNQEDNAKILATLSKNYHIFKFIKNFLTYVKDLSVFVLIRIYTINTDNLNLFVCLMQFDVKEIEIYTRAMQKPNTTKQAKAIKKKLN